MFVSDFLANSTKPCGDVSGFALGFVGLQHFDDPRNVLVFGERRTLSLEVVEVSASKLPSQPRPEFLDRVGIGAVRWDLPQTKTKPKQSWSLAKSTPKPSQGQSHAKPKPSHAKPSPNRAEAVSSRSQAKPKPNEAHHLATEKLNKKNAAKFHRR